jgi:hypothetical protein
VKLCEYGCGQEAKYQFKNGRWCCSRYFSCCPNIIKKNSESQKNKTHSKKTRKKISEAGKERVPWNRGKTKIDDNRILKQSNSLKLTWRNLNSYLNSERHRVKLKEVQNRKDVKDKKRKKKLTINKIKKHYSFFSQIEEMRYNPDKPGEKEIQVHCKNHNCPNSKEQGGWFTPTYNQVYERIRQIENPDGNGGSYFYCSGECKKQCPLFNLYSDPLKDIETTYTQEEYQQFREFVLNRDDYKCQYCGEKAEHIHHERPQKLEPFFALDPDLAWSVCEKCHYKYGHKTGTECSTGNLASQICL